MFLVFSPSGRYWYRSETQDGNVDLYCRYMEDVTEIISRYNLSDKERPTREDIVWFLEGGSL